MRLIHVAVLLTLPLSGCSLVFSGDEYVFGDASGDTGVADTIASDVPDAGDTGTDTLDAVVPPDARGPTSAAETLFGSAGNRTCATFGADGDLWCWGSEHLGDGSPAGERRASLVAGTFLSGEVGFAHVCAIRADEKMVCWGRGDSAQLGWGDIGSRGTPTAVLPMTFDWSAVSAGVSHTCAIHKLMDAVHCTGTNPGSTSAFEKGVVPLLFSPITEGDTAAHVADAIATGASFTCVVSTSDQQVYCWGDLSDFGGTADDPPIAASDSAEFMDGFSALCAGDRHVCAITAVAPAELYCWGANGEGQIGISPVLTNSAPDPLLAGEYVAVTCGATHTCAIDVAGRIDCWGADEEGQLGNGPPTGSDSTPTQVDFGGAHFWTQLASGGPGGRTTCAIDESSELWCWGSNMNGQGDPTTSIPVLTEPVRVFPP